MPTPANSLNLAIPGIVHFDGVSVFTGLTTTQHGVQIGGAANGLTSLTGSTNTVLLGNTGADPTFGTVPTGALPGSGQITLSNGTNVSVTGSPVTLGGTATINVAGPPSATTLTNHGVVLGQGTSAVVATAAGNSGQILQSGGSSADAAYSTATYPSTAGTSGKILISDGTNIVSSTATYPSSTTANQILYSSATSTIGGLTSAANSVLVTNGSSVPSLASTLPSAVQGNITTTGTITSGTWNGTTIDVPHGGTGQTSLTSHGVLVGAATSAITQLAAGTSGQVLQSGGASADPAYSTATYPSTAGTSGKVLISNGTNIVASTPTFPNASATSGTFIRSDGTNWIASTPTFPTSAGTSGKILQSNGTNYVESTPTYPSASGTARKIIISDGTNNVYSTETYAVPGTSGNVLTSDGTNWTSAAAAGSGPIYVSLNVTSAQIKTLHATPITVVAAAGAGKVIQICSPIYTKFIYGGTNVFIASNAQTIALAYGGFSNSGTSALLTNANIVSSSSTYSVVSPSISGGSGITNYENSALQVINTTAFEISGNAAGNNTLTVSFFYFVITI